MKKSSKIILSIFTPVITLLIACFALAFLSPKTSAVATIGNGGAVYVEPGMTFSFTKGTISGHSAPNGGAFYVAPGATLNVSGGTISGNTASTGGGIYNDKDGTTNITGGTFSNNTGGDIYNSGTLNLNGGTFSGKIENNGTLNYTKATLNTGFSLLLTKAMVFKAAPTANIPITLATGLAKVGTTIATKDSGITVDVSKLVVSNLPANTRLVVESNNIVIRYVQRTITLAVANSEYGSMTVDNSDDGPIDTTRLIVDHGTTWSYSGNVLTIGTTKITAKPTANTAQYSYSFAQWFNLTNTGPLATSGTITSDMSIRVIFTISLRYYDVTIVASPSSYGSVSHTSLTVPYGTTWSTNSSGNLVFANGDSTIVTATAGPGSNGNTYSFYRWTPYTGTVREDTTITANFIIVTGKSYTVTFDKNITTSLSNSISETQPLAVDTPATTPYFSKDKTEVAPGTTYEINYSTSTVALKPSLAMGYTISFSDGQSVTLKWKNGTGTNHVTFTFNRWGCPTSGTINSDFTMTAYFTQKGTGGIVIYDPTQPEQPGIEDIGIGQETAFIDRRKRTYTSVASLQDIKEYKGYDICYPI